MLIETLLSKHVSQIFFNTPLIFTEPIFTFPDCIHGVCWTSSVYEAIAKKKIFQINSPDGRKYKTMHASIIRTIFILLSVSLLPVSSSFFTH